MCFSFSSSTGKARTVFVADRMAAGLAARNSAKARSTAIWRVSPRDSRGISLSIAFSVHAEDAERSWRVV